MAYCSADEVIDMLKDDILNPIIGNAYIDDLEQRRSVIRPLAEDAIRDADAEIDGYLMKRYPVPMSPAPAVISKYSRDIAIYNLVSRAGIDEGERESNYLTRYKAAISFLIPALIRHSFRYSFSRLIRSSLLHIPPHPGCLPCPHPIFPGMAAPGY